MFLVVMQIAGGCTVCGPVSSHDSPVQMSTEEVGSAGKEGNVQVDVSTGSAVAAATAHAKSIPLGSLRMTAFSAWNTADLIGIDGRSVIVRLPGTAPENSRAYMGQQWYVSGQARGHIQYSPGYSSRYVERTRDWLFDIALLKNWFAEKPDREVVVFRRLKSLDLKQHIRSGGTKLVLPDGCMWDDSHMLVFDVVHDLPVVIGSDLPVAIWYAHEEGMKSGLNLVEKAKSAPFACVFYLRFQEEHP